MNFPKELLQVYPAGEARAIWRMLMEVRFGLSHADLLLGKDKELSRAEQAEAEKLVARLLEGEPIQYVLGQADFCGRTFGVAPGVLIPRPETEELVACVLAACRPCRALDVGTGSGCIATTLALEGFETTAFDISHRALVIARENAASLGAQVDFRQEDILHPEATDEQWQLIVSNPPYVRQSEAEEMERNVLQHEPHEALFVPDEDPLLFYRALARYAQEHLAAGGWLCVEINRTFGSQTRNLLLTEGFAEATLLQDSWGNDRIIKARKT